MAVVNYAQIGAAVTATTTAETVAAVLPPDSNLLPDAIGRVVRGYLNITTGAGTTAVVIRVRTGTTTGGTLVGAANTHTLAAGASASIPFSEIDTAAAAPANNQYCVTFQQTAATANGTANDGAIVLETPQPAGGAV